MLCVGTITGLPGAHVQVTSVIRRPCFLRVVVLPREAIYHRHPSLFWYRSLGYISEIGFVDGMKR